MERELRLYEERVKRENEDELREEEKAKARAFVETIQVPQQKECEEGNECKGGEGDVGHEGVLENEIDAEETEDEAELVRGDEA